MKATVHDPSRTRRVGWLWVLVLVLTAVFQFLRGALAECVIFTAAAVTLALTKRSRVELHVPVPSRWALVFGVVVVSLVLIVLPDESPAMAIALLVIGAYVLSAGWGSGTAGGGVPGPSRGSGSRTRTVIRADILWVLLAVLVCVWELSAFALGVWTSSGPPAHPTISDLFEPLLSGEPWRALLTTAWVAGGAALLRRGRRA